MFALQKQIKMKKIITSLFILSIATSVWAQNKNTAYRIKTNPLSTFVAVEPNINLSLERVFDGEKNRLSFQGSVGYIYDWLIFNSNTDINMNAINGYVVSGEFRNYDKSGFYFGPYLQYKNINASYNYINSTNTTTMQVKKITYSAGILGGYYHSLSKSIGTEFSIGFGFSNKKLSENNVKIKSYTNDSPQYGILLEETGRQPQFIFTYKLTYTLPSFKK
jgi:Protein of unknown function (DUF3575)